MKWGDLTRLVRVGAATGGREVGPLVLAVAFSIQDTLAPTGDLQAAARRMPLEDLLPKVAELVRPAPGTLRVLRELEGLAVPLALVGHEPSPLAKKIAGALWFRGDVIVAGAGGTIEAFANHAGLPAACLWFVTADPVEAAAAREAGLNPVLLESGTPGSFAQTDSRGFFVARQIDDVLEILRIPYTRSVMSLRHMFHALLPAIYRT